MGGMGGSWREPSEERTNERNSAPQHASPAMSAMPSSAIPCVPRQTDGRTRTDGEADDGRASLRNAVGRTDGRTDGESGLWIWRDLNESKAGFFCFSFLPPAPARLLLHGLHSTPLRPMPFFRFTLFTYHVQPPWQQ